MVKDNNPIIYEKVKFYPQGNLQDTQYIEEEIKKKELDGFKFTGVFKSKESIILYFKKNKPGYKPKPNGRVSTKNTQK